MSTSWSRRNAGHSGQVRGNIRQIIQLFFLKIEILFSTFTQLGLYSDKIRIRPAAVLICNDYTNGTTEDKVDKYDLWSNIRGSRLNQNPRERII